VESAQQHAAGDGHEQLERGISQKPEWHRCSGFSAYLLLWACLVSAGWIGHACRSMSR
nr:hypothetical protein [Tanacetum cinerariifolium]